MANLRGVLGRVARAFSLSIDVDLLLHLLQLESFQPRPDRSFRRGLIVELAHLADGSLGGAGAEEVVEDPPAV
jgi:hypothetical protein